MTEDDYKWNEMYNNILRHNDSLTGLVAYALYKKSKVEWTEQFIVKNGRQPTIAEIASHRDAVQGEEHINRLLRDAESQLDDFAREHLDLEISESLSEAYGAGLEDEMASSTESLVEKFESLNTNIATTKEIVSNLQNKSNNSFLMGIISNIIGAFAIFIIALLGFWLYQEIITTVISK